MHIPPDLPKNFLPAYTSITRLEHYDRYLAAYIFGSVARREATCHSDLDVNIIVDEDNICTNINHPIINGIKLDITFLSLAQLKDQQRNREARAASYDCRILHCI